MEKTYLKDVSQKAGKSIVVAGWVHARRDMGKIIFIDLRDSTGILQVVFAPNDKELLEKANDLRPEFCIRIKGQINERPEKQRKENMITGTVEMLAEELTILNESKTPPFEIDKDTTPVNEELRLKHRYLDIRSERMHKNLVLRDNVISFFRTFLHNEGFIEVETPVLTKGTPEGAGEYLVPSRVHPGKFYVLPQAPQQFKQLLMVGGVERYFQIARCMRVEDLRGDRQPEFTQLDMEMSFVTQEDILELNERMMIELIKEVMPNKKISKTPFPRLTYAESMEKYGNDKPDLRKNKEDNDELAFCWVVDFPLFEKGDNGGLQSVHHPFCMPHPEDRELLDIDPLKVRGWTYDLVLNGVELSSGSIRDSGEVRPHARSV